MKKLFALIISILFLFNSTSFSFDDPFTPNINEGAIGSGFDDPFTPNINEGAIGSGFDDPFTPNINEGAISW